MRKLFFGILTVASLSGCATTETKPLASQALGALAHQSIGHTVRPAPGDFRRVTVTEMAIGGALGVLLSGTAGEFAVANGIVDPSQSIAADLAAALAAHAGALAVTRPVPVSTDDVALVANAARPGVRYIVDVKTIGWGFSYLPKNWTHYHVGYRATARLIDTATGTVIAEGQCIPGRGSDIDGNPPTYDQLVADRAALVKATLADYARACVRSLKGEMLGLGGTAEQPAAVVASAVPAVSQPQPTAPQPQPKLPAPPGEAVMPGSQHWSGVMSCGALVVSQPGWEPYKAVFAMEVAGSTVTVHRKTKRGVETLSGQLMNGQLELEGSGYTIDEPAKHWRFQMHGSFEPGATTYIATGAKIANGKRIRDCELRMMRI